MIMIPDAFARQHSKRGPLQAADAAVCKARGSTCTLNMFGVLPSKIHPVGKCLMPGGDYKEKCDSSSPGALSGTIALLQHSR